MIEYLLQSWQRYQ